MAQARQGKDETAPAPDPLHEAEAALRSREAPGIRVGKWTLRWAGDPTGGQWTVGQWKGKPGSREWAHASWFGRFDQALRRLLERNVEGDVDELAEAVARVERAARQIMIALRYNIMK